MRCTLNTLRPRQNGRYFADDTFKLIFFNENVGISIKISLKFIPKVRINNIPALVQIMAWRRPGDKPLSEPMMVCLLTHICVTRPQWVNVLHSPIFPRLTHCGLMTPYYTSQVKPVHNQAAFSHSPEGNSTGNVQDIYPLYDCEIY